MKAWPECRQIIEHIDNQMFTQTCIYFGLTHVLSDRFCVETKGQVIVTLSAWDLFTCCPKQSDLLKCLWEQVSLWIPLNRFYSLKGITTGGSIWHADSGCKPFPVEHCSYERITS